MLYITGMRSAQLARSIKETSLQIPFYSPCKKKIKNQTNHLQAFPKEQVSALK